MADTSPLISETSPMMSETSPRPPQRHHNQHTARLAKRHPIVHKDLKQQDIARKRAEQRKVRDAAALAAHYRDNPLYDGSEFIAE